ncbi:MAG: nucleotidyl transferase AbiEii/AbiGii toxin family protein [Gammaproteobacteria bacterium]|uniref:nucleotidyl transferase AbiEii/AbiGii toxin family protein n=1 Tax=Limnobacter sp. TaxID=2003368 RepID=UPI001DFE9BB5|nr:nucleotidyl transferase AbiEii/AbiGii toxin family protein [Gammaproteobacteria bacterium]MBU0848562.1 nucleotidyl transferase AbiEii/AbiGii toxin family protein [Gammaproteobacteria bacterium]MBU1267301.1 nucleotidyl transferase AbiEii/AbiGii toxin family protein [Gammaproteobacteria bacterium]MBU1530326.1 nucleotidyl transferase AbiEii/AbiGii toxin family protein [Gammaproteobacteria bacterium]MBU1780229.1 nucleotidyl transferase AbiEii/AbiGii toxin family protein [Gammaproteobacteria bact
MFKRKHHQVIEQVLRLLNADLLRERRCYFGGGTAIALRFGEYRESVDIDLMLSDLASYRVLRNLVRDAGSVMPLFKESTTLISQLRETRADQYGIRTTLGIGQDTIKFEIVLEGRIEFDTPAATDEVCNVSTLSVIDLAASKLLANSDRWADEGAFNRDVIDLAMMKPTAQIFVSAYSKAEMAYGASIRQDLEKAIGKLLEKPEWLEKCMRTMSMHDTPPANMVSTLLALRGVLKKLNGT